MPSFFLAEMFRRKLRALDYHSSDSIDVSKSCDVKALVFWLENKKIRNYKIEDRAPLRDQSDEAWKTTFKKYLNSLECPFNCETELTSAVDWLVCVALRYEYADAAENNEELLRGLQEAKPLDKDVGTKSPLDIDPSDTLFVSAIQALAKILLISSHPDVSVLLEACKIVIEEKLSKDALETASAKQKTKSKEDKQYNISPKDCGFELPDPCLGEAAKVLRLLHIQELRYLQTNINGLIVAVQNITANPKTDQSLGQVGR